MIKYKSLISEIKLVCEKTNNYIQKAKISDSKNAYKYLKPLWPEDLNYKEVSMALYLNKSNNTIGYSVISIGGVSSTIIDGKILFQEALLCNASNIILAHNHPSGNLKPSNVDVNLTKNLLSFGKKIGINILDHIIMTNEAYLSLADESLM